LGRRAHIVSDFDHSQRGARADPPAVFPSENRHFDAFRATGMRLAKGLASGTSLLTGSSFMTSAIRISVAAALSFTSITLAHAQGADVERRQVVALADTGAVRWSAVDEPPDRYAGRYVTADGQTFSITIADDALTLEAPASWDDALVTLRALGSQSFAAAD